MSMYECPKCGGVPGVTVCCSDAQTAQAGHVPEASCGECGKKASDGWALYCVACMEKAGLPGGTSSPPLTHSCTSSLVRTDDSTAQAVPVLTDDPLYVFAHEIIHGAYKPSELKDAAMRAIRHHSAVRAKLGAAGWIATADQMPPPGQVVLACYTNDLGNLRRIRAQWVAAKTSESSDIDDAHSEYDEATDTYYDPEGWYECIDNWDEYSSVFVRATITHWMPLPPPPGIVGKEGA